MEKLLIYALLLGEGLITEEAYRKCLDELFMADPENANFLDLEWEPDAAKAVSYILAQTDYKHFAPECFDKQLLMYKLRAAYTSCSDIKDFAARTYRLWLKLPEKVRDEEPFLTLCYAGDPLSYGDEEKAKSLYEKMFSCGQAW